MNTVIRMGKIEERAFLEDLQRRASLVDGAYREQLLAHPEAIELPAGHIAGTLVIEADGIPIGFAVVTSDGEAAELDGLFVEPEQSGRGFGGKLVEAAKALAAERGARQLHVIAGPKSQGFYERHGFAFVESAPTLFGPAVKLLAALDAGDG